MPLSGLDGQGRLVLQTGAKLAQLCGNAVYQRPWTLFMKPYG